MITLEPATRALALVALAVLTAAATAFNARHTYLATRPGPRIVFAETVPPAHDGAPIQSAIDLVTAADRRVSATTVPSLRRRDALTIDGWAVDVAASAPAAAVLAVVDGDTLRPATPVNRPDVARALHCVCGEAGYHVTVRAASLAPGLHVAGLRYVTADATRYVEGPRLRFTVR